jgi:gamma-glutamyl:cysteine ligase YbdK (ATP-grasp superfamily)
MSGSERYHAMANGPAAPEEMTIDAPNVTLSADTVMPESLITSIQPHYQVAHAADLPTYFNYALRVAGPLLALATNSPFFPPDLYDDVGAGKILADGYAENRILVFESVLNNDGVEKVRFPRDLDSVEEAVDRVAGDATVVPMPVPTGNRFDDEFATLRRKHGTYWRWVRPVFDGASRSSANARIEFRPIAAQPTVRDSLAFQATFAGLMESLPRRQHPATDQQWSTARENFYAAMRGGLDSGQRWICNDGAETVETERVYEDIFAHAIDGLTAAGCSESEAERHVEPLRARVERGTTPADWKIARVREYLADGAAFEDAVWEMQRDYVRNQRETLLDGSFTDWL